MIYKEYVQTIRLPIIITNSIDIHNLGDSFNLDNASFSIVDSLALLMYESEAIVMDISSVGTQGESSVNGSVRTKRLCRVNLVWREPLGTLKLNFVPSLSSTSVHLVRRNHYGNPSRT